MFRAYGGGFRVHCKGLWVQALGLGLHALCLSPAELELCHCIANSGTFQAIGPAVEDDELQKERQLETCPLEDGKEGDVETLLALPCGHGCSSYRMLSKHERDYALGMDALVIVCSRNTNEIMLWAWML